MNEDSEGMVPDSPHSILYVNSVPNIGGAEASLIELVTHLDRRRYNPILLTMEAGPLADAFHQIDVPVFYLSFPFFSRKRPWIYWWEIASIVRLIRRHQIKLIHVNCDRAVPHAVLAGKLARVPVVCYIHDMDRAWYLPRYVRYLNRCEQIIADSEATAKHCLDAGMNPERMRTIYECFEMDRYLAAGSDERGRIRAGWSLDDSHLAIGLIGQILRHKGHEDFLRAASLISEKHPEACFFIIGDDRMSDDPDFLPFLKRLTHDLGLSEVVTFTGRLTDIPAVMAALDIVVVPSWAEPFGRVVVEALATSRAVVATSAGGIPEIIESGQNGILVPPRGPEQLAEAIATLCANQELRMELAQRGPDSVRRFDVHEHARQFYSLYSQLGLN